MKSKIFTKAEIKAFNIVSKGDRTDPTGIFTSRIKPKILEILDWFKRRKELEKLIKPIKRKK